LGYAWDLGSYNYGGCSKNIITSPESIDIFVDEGCWNLRLIMHVHHAPVSFGDIQSINNN